MSRYTELPSSHKDVELAATKAPLAAPSENDDDDDDDDTDDGNGSHFDSTDALTGEQEHGRHPTRSLRVARAAIAIGLVSVVVLSTLYHWTNWVPNPRTFFGPPPPPASSTVLLREGTVPGPEEASPPLPTRQVCGQDADEVVLARSC